MATASMTQTQPPRKAPRAYYAHLDDQAGALAKVDGTIYFMTDTGALTAIEPEHCTFLTVLGEIGLADTQQIMDRMHGSYAKIACTRPMLEVR
jgi:hypothetical protein